MGGRQRIDVDGLAGCYINPLLVRGCSRGAQLHIVRAGRKLQALELAHRAGEAAVDKHRGVFVAGVERDGARRDAAIAERIAVRSPKRVVPAKAESGRDDQGPPASRADACGAARKRAMQAVAIAALKNRIVIRLVSPSKAADER